MFNDDRLVDETTLALAAFYRLARARARAVRELQAQPIGTSPGEPMDEAEDVQALQSGHEGVGEVGKC